MWIAMNDNFVSIVKHAYADDIYIVRARVREDLVNLFPLKKDDILETKDSDYRFRLFVTPKAVADIVSQRIMDIDYSNFKNSVIEDWRYAAYSKIWLTMMNVQIDKYGIKPWHLDYKEKI